MKQVRKNIMVGWVAILIVFCLVPVMADDNEIFGTNSAPVEANVLIIFDNSGSMKATAVSDCHQECQEQRCAAWGPCETWDRQCYQRRVHGRWVEVCQDVCVSRSCEQWECKKWETVCENRSRMAVAQETVKRIIDQYADRYRFGIMIFHDNNNDSSNGGYFAEYQGKYPVCEVKDAFVRDESGRVKTGEAYHQAVAEYKDYLKGFVDTLSPRGLTPLAETLAEAGLYFAEKPSWFNAGTANYPRSGRYPDAVVDAYNPDFSHPPMEHRCRKNYIILMTDGEPTEDDSSRLRGRYINDDFIAGGDLPTLDEVAGYLHDNDINAFFDTPDYTQNVLVYAIGFQGGDTALLQDTADRGTGAGNNKNVDDGGLYFNATSPEDLSRAFETIMFSIGERRTFFAAPVVPVSHSSKAYAGDSVYLSLFQPSGEGQWIGNLKKYSLNDDNVFSSCGTQAPILDETGNISDSARSCWSTVPDGNAVDQGGAGERLAVRSDESRRIYANIGAEADLSQPANAFSTSNGALSAGDLGVSDEDAKDALINQVRRRDDAWRLGDLNHSQPVVVDCGPDAGVHILVGANDGMLHCFNDLDGEEAWAFIPRSQFGRLKETASAGHVYFMDGSPALAETAQGNRIVVCGERRGGRRYHAIDITDINRPVFLYSHVTEGQSWKTPQFMRLMVKGGGPVEAFLLTGGYDPRVDEDLPAESGCSVYTINALTGKKEGLTVDRSVFADMSCLVSASGMDLVDDGLAIVSQIYAADMAGHLYGFRDNDKVDDDKALDGVWQQRLLFSVTSGGRKIFADVDVAPEKIRYYDDQAGQWTRVAGDYVYFGTGDRANPLRPDQVDRFYCIKNDWRTGPLTIDGVVGDYPTLDDDPGSDPDGNDHDPVILDVTDNLVQDGTSDQQRAMIEALSADFNRGWFITLEHPGEKCLSTPLVFDGVVYFTTYTPPPRDSAENADDPCLNENPRAGVSRLYALDYQNGAAVYVFSGDDDKPGKDDRCQEILEGLVSIAPSPLGLITDHGPEVMAGVHGLDPKGDMAGVRRFYWKIDD